MDASLLPAEKIIAIVKHYLVSLVLVFLLPLFALGQVGIEEVDYNRIEQRRVIEYLAYQQAHQIENFTDIKASNIDTANFGRYAFYSQKTVIKAPLDSVWAVYCESSPAAAWKSKKSSLGFIYDRNEDAVIYVQDKIEGVTLGQILFLNLRLIKGLFNMATALEVTKMDKTKGLIEMSYLETGVSRGCQQLHLTETADGHTLITHTSTIQSDSKFRDRILYPFFHNKIIRKFHKNMKQLALGRASSSNNI